MKFDRNNALLQTEIPELKLISRGKVRDIYDLGERLLFVATDRISAFDVVMQNGIPDKGRTLTAMSVFWFKFLSWLPNHFVTTEISTFPELKKYQNELEGRSLIVEKATPLPIECIVRGYLVGSGWSDYKKTGSVCGTKLRENYKQAEKLDAPLFTPSTKAEQGAHDENISFDKAKEIVGNELAEKIKEYSIRAYNDAANYALTKKIIIADTKFEFGLLNNKLIMIDEVLTPDSSRFWPLSEYKTGSNPPSLDKQFLRDYLETLNWNKKAPGPELPDEIVFKTREKYLSAYKMLTGEKLI
ncbi:MAG TPA: phosphoribosylaminoimidazolesuccinocarboxamide synthase [Victivallales bacterium]|nr:phosphoribosylaminoimidazolesuccinocarboxamide synthase [Victivallales bacterium]HPO91305.1 phosphoribosylaminoimidazolesuccinocarboxamide synthase [Victivallales bacterium]HRR29409.1 phosphoribosylaminoimidazolesuccinocarboxamide synthase [Victivallales bacterium]HRU01488.1 phosphoribosylaminoimidazolesuccinocarboxamide synthase [Victivallales bacterium]